MTPDPTPDTGPGLGFGGVRGTGTETETVYIVTARGLGLEGDHGRVYGPVDLDVPTGGLTVLRGHPGNGRTCLLLTLAGRMRPSEGTLTVCGQTSSHRIFGHAAIAGFSAVDKLDPAVRVRTLVAEQRDWTSPWWSPRHRVGQPEVDEMMAPVLGGRRPPEAAMHVGDLPELDRMLLRIALAWAEGPDLLVVDDLEQLRVEAERAFVTTRLAELGRRATVLASAVEDLPPGSPDHHLVTLPATKDGLYDPEPWTPSDPEATEPTPQHPATTGEEVRP